MDARRIMIAIITGAGRLTGAVCLYVGLVVGVVSGQVAAQGLFSPVLVVNDTLVTNYQLNQRVTFLTLLGAQGNIRELALNQLTVEAIQVATATEAGFVPGTEAIEAGQAEFAARANLTREEFIAALDQGGVDPATFRDFITAGVAWRGYVQDRFRETAENFAPILLDQAIQTADLEAGRRVLLSEIILPAGTPEAARISRNRAQRFSRLVDAEAFSEAAREFSLANSRFRGGEVDWRLLTDLPDPIAAAVGSLQPGRTSRPVDLDESIGVFHVRDVELTPPTTPRFASVDYQVLRLPAGAEAEANRIAAGLDRCEDIHRFAGRYPAEALSRQTTLLSALPSDVARVVSTLDAGEASTALGSAEAPRVLMVCARTFGEDAPLDLARLRLGIVNQRLQLIAAAHLNELRARAVIVEPEG